MKDRIKESTLLGIKANATRVLELINQIDFKSDSLYWDNYRELAELKCKMKELRRDTVKLEQEIKGY